MTRSWVRSLYNRIYFSRRAATRSRPIITQSLWEDINTQYLHDIASAVRTYNIPEEFILNADQTPSKYVPTTNVTMTEQDRAHISVRGGDDKRAITVTVTQGLSGKMLPFHIIFTGKTKRCLLKMLQVKKISYFRIMKSIGVETLSLIDKIIVPYIENIKKYLQVPNDQKSLLIWDAYKGQGSPRVQVRLAEVGVVVVIVPKDMTHLLQPLDVIINGTIKKFEKRNSVIILPP